MNEQIDHLAQADEEILICTISDEALEAAASSDPIEPALAGTLCLGGSAWYIQC
jgi:hypothetical protein